MILGALLLLGLVLPHEDSVSSSLIDVRADAITIELRFQALSIDEVLPLDANADGRIQVEEVHAQTSAMGAYLTAHYSILAGDELPEGGVDLQGKLLEVNLDKQTLELDTDQQWLTARLEYPRERSSSALWIDVSLFSETSPGHKDFAQLAGTDETDHSPSRMWIFSRSDPQWLVRLPKVDADAVAPVQSGFGLWVRLGFRHILSGADHLCFVLGLLLAASGLRSLAGTITAFTVAHSITLAAVALGWLTISPALTEPLIAASIVFVGVANIRSKGPRRAWPEAFGFGLLHGLGFAALLADALGSEQARLVPLLGFNLGIESGQLLAAAAVVAALAIIPRSSERPPESGLAPPQLAHVASLGIAAAGLFWLGARLVG